MKFTPLLLALLLLIFSYSSAEDPESTNYISPGIRISWNFKSSVLLDAKVSFGRMRSEKYYYNFTIGKKVVLSSGSMKARSNQHYYLDLQTGSFFDHYPLSAGGGAGVAIFNESQEIILFPRLTIFGGAGLFSTMDYVFIKNQADFGLQIVLPYPFDEDYRDFSQ